MPSRVSRDAVRSCRIFSKRLRVTRWYLARVFVDAANASLQSVLDFEICVDESVRVADAIPVLQGGKSGYAVFEW